MKFGFIGCGNMGGAVARAVCKGAGAREVLLANRTPAKAQALAAELGCACGTNEQVAASCDFLFLGVKPQMMEDMLDELAPVLESRAESRPFVLVTMAAGLTMHQIRQMAGSGYPVIRMMPNTPVSLGAGMIQYCYDDVELEQLDHLFLAQQQVGVGLANGVIGQQLHHLLLVGGHRPLHGDSHRAVVPEGGGDPVPLRDLHPGQSQGTLSVIGFAGDGVDGLAVGDVVSGLWAGGTGDEQSGQQSGDQQGGGAAAPG